FHGVCHYQFLEAVAELSRTGGYLGSFSLTADMHEVVRYRQAVAAVFQQMPHHVSIVSSSIVAALEGHYGNHHSTDRTAGSTLWINPLMAHSWCFRLRDVAKRVMYLEQMKQMVTYNDVDEVIEVFRFAVRDHKPWQAIPV